MELHRQIGRRHHRPILCTISSSPEHGISISLSVDRPDARHAPEPETEP
jgi:hypothetical protein